MVEYQMVSVGLLVEPESFWKRDSNKGRKNRRHPKSFNGGGPCDNSQVFDGGDEGENLTIGFEYRPDFRDFIINVSEVESATDKGKEMQADAEKDASGLRILKRVETIDSDGCEDKVTRRPSRKQGTQGGRSSQNQLGRPLHSHNRYGRSIEGGQRSVGAKASGTSLNCDYYRQKFLQEGILHVQESNEYAEWLKFDSTNLSAGQKVVKKISAQQKALEAEAEKQRKKLSGGSRSGSDTSQNSSNGFVPPKRKPTKLDPLPVQVRICLDDSPSIVKVM